MSEALSQADIDALLSGVIGSSTNNPAMLTLTAAEVDTLGEIGNISMGSAATALYSILGRKVMITTPQVTVTTLEQLAEGHLLPYLVVNVGYSEGFAGNNLFILQLDDVKVITDIMMGGDGHPDMDQDLSELHISAISEAMNQMMGGMSTAMADMFGRKVNITPPTSLLVRLSDAEIRNIFSSIENELISISFKMEIDGLIDSKIMQLMPMSFGRQLSGSLTPAPAAPIKPAAAAKPVQTPAAKPAAPVPAVQPAPARITPPVDVRPIQLSSFDETAAGTAIDSSIDLILDVPLMITVELGQCRKTIKEILDLNIGSIITLDKLAGEPVDIVANGKPVAKGEVIVVDDSYGIRITEVLNNSKVRMK